MIRDSLVGGRMEKLWLENVQVGSKFRTAEYEVTREEVIEFAQKYDPQPFHLSETTAAQTFFKGLAASGWHTAAITMRLVVTSGIPIATGIIGASVDLTWPSPTRVGDILRVELDVTEVKPSQSNPSRGFVTAVYETLNQRGDVRQHTTAKMLLFARTGN
jgi:acyl dehydratase